MSANYVMLIGNMVKNPELKTTPNSCVTNFTLAQNKNVKGDKSTQYHNCVAWGKTAELVVKYLSKGKQVAVSGELQSRNYDDKDTGKKIYVTEVLVKEITFLGAVEKKEAIKLNQPEYTVDSIPF